MPLVALGLTAGAAFANTKNAQPVNDNPHRIAMFSAAKDGIEKTPKLQTKTPVQAGQPDGIDVIVNLFEFACFTFAAGAVITGLGFGVMSLWAYIRYERKEKRWLKKEWEEHKKQLAALPQESA